MPVKLVRALITIIFTLSLFGCGPPTPESCQMNHTATNAVAGVAVGAAVGFLAAKATNKDPALGAAVGAAAGGFAGAVIGKAQDNACHELAVKTALNQALAMYQSKQKGAPTRSSAITAPETAPTQAGTPKSTNSTVTLADYQTVEWANAVTKNSGAITPLETAQASPEKTCISYSDQETVDGKTQTTVVKRCAGPDGEWETENQT